MSSGIRIPADLVRADLSMAQVMEILDNRSAVKRLQNRIAAYPDRLASMRLELSALKDKEAALLSTPAPANGATEG